MRLLILWFLVFFGCIKFCKILYKNNADRNEGLLRDKKRLCDDLKIKNDNTNKQKNILDMRSFALSQIYEINKKMSSVLKKEEIVSIYSSFLKDSKVDYREYSTILDQQLALHLKKATLYESVEKLSITDGLTDIYLRRYFANRLLEELRRSDRLKLKFSILMIDIDNFKMCNDKYGHLVGDVALREIALFIKNNVREIDLVARYGGEEFTVILPETDRSGAVYVAERVRKTIEEKTIKAYDESLRLTVSIGISVYPKDAASPKQLIERADMALYESKQGGKNRVTCWNG